MMFLKLINEYGKFCPICKEELIAVSKVIYKENKYHFTLKEYGYPFIFHSDVALSGPIIKIDDNDNIINTWGKDGRTIIIEISSFCFKNHYKVIYFNLTIKTYSEIYGLPHFICITEEIKMGEYLIRNRDNISTVLKLKSKRYMPIYDKIFSINNVTRNFWPIESQVKFEEKINKLTSLI